jgi:hypothetical protein
VTITLCPLEVEIEPNISYLISSHLPRDPVYTSLRHDATNMSFHSRSFKSKKYRNYGMDNIAMLSRGRGQAIRSKNVSIERAKNLMLQRQMRQGKFQLFHVYWQSLNPGLLDRVATGSCDPALGDDEVMQDLTMADNILDGTQPMELSHAGGEFVELRDDIKKEM